MFNVLLCFLVIDYIIISTWSCSSILTGKINLITKSEKEIFSTKQIDSVVNNDNVDNSNVIKSKIRTNKSNNLTKKKKSKRNIMKKSKKIKTSNKLDFIYMLKSFFITLFDPTCGGKLNMNILNNNNGTSTSSSTSMNNNNPFLHNMANTGGTFGPVCGPNGCF